MTNKEARDLLARIEIKEPNEVIVNSWWGSFVKDYQEALQMAIESLEQQKIGHWDIMSSEICKCSECKQFSDKVTNFCPNCGVRMVIK